MGPGATLSIYVQRPFLHDASHKLHLLSDKGMPAYSASIHRDIGSQLQIGTFVKTDHDDFFFQNITVGFDAVKPESYTVC